MLRSSKRFFFRFYPSAARTSFQRNQNLLFSISSQPSERKEVDTNVFKLTALMSQYGKENKMNEVFNVYQQMKDMEMKIDAYAYSVLLSSLIRHGHFNKAWDCYCEIKSKNNVIPNIFLYNAIVHLLLKLRKYYSIDPLLEEMERNNIPPNIITFTILISNYCKANRYNDALKSYRKMINMGIELDEKMYNNLLFISSKNKDDPWSKEIIDSISKLDSQLPISLKNSNLSSLINEGKVQEAFVLFEKYLNTNEKMNAVDFSMMINALVLRREYGEARKMIKLMKKERIKPNVHIYTCLLRACGKCDYEYDVKNILDLMQLTEHELHGLVRSLVPNLNFHTYAVIMQKYSSVKHVKDMKDGKMNSPIENYIEKHVISRKICLSGVYQRYEDDHLLDERKMQDAMAGYVKLLTMESLVLRRGFTNALIQFMLKCGRKKMARNLWVFVLRNKLFPECVVYRDNLLTIDLHSLSEPTGISVLIWQLAQMAGEIRCSVLSDSGSQPGRTEENFEFGVNPSGVLDSGGSYEKRVFPKIIRLITGWGRHSQYVGKSNVKNSVDDFIRRTGVPFSLSKRNEGMFVSYGEKLQEWLMKEEIFEWLQKEGS